MSVAKLKTKDKEERKHAMSAMKIDHDAIKSLAVLLNDTGLTEIEIADGDQRIRVMKQGMPVQTYAAAPAPVAAAAPVAAVPAAKPENRAGTVKSPMVGTAYLQSEPGAPHFVTKGATVKAGDTLLIIEAMKVMNPIKADRAGTVTDIFIEDGHPVEFDQPLVVIE